MSKPDPLIPPQDLEPSRPELLRRIPGLNQDFIVDVSGDDEAARALACWLLFEHWPELAGVELDAKRRFYNHFFWAVRFFALRDLMTGRSSSGLEQQAFKLIERAAEEVPDVDWELVREIEARARDVQRSSAQS